MNSGGNNFNKTNSSTASKIKDGSSIKNQGLSRIKDRKLC